MRERGRPGLLDGVMRPEPSRSREHIFLKRRVMVLLNCAAGTGERYDPERLVGTLTAAFRAHELEPLIEIVPAGELAVRAQKARERATAGEIDAVLIGGGDGSVSTCAAALVDTAVPLGVIPLGTLNNFARDLGIPLGLGKAVELIARGCARSVDVAEVNGRTFINNSSIGIYPYLVLDRERRRRLYGTRKWKAMLLGALRSLRYFPVRRLAISASGWSSPARTPVAFIGNNEYRVTGPRIGRRARLDGGELCLYIARQQSRLALFWLGVRAFFGFLDRARDLNVHRAPSIQIHSRRRRLLLACDGELHVLRTPLNYRVRPRALWVLAPPEP